MPAGGEARLRLVLAAVDKTAAPIRKLNRRIEAMSAPIRRVRGALRSLSREAGLPRLASGARMAGRALRRMALAGTAALAAVAAATTKAAATGDEIAKLARQVGIGAETLQEYEFAADRAGVSNAVFRQSLGALAKRVGELKRGGGALATFEKVLPGVTAALKGATGTAEALEIVNNAIANLDDPLKQNAFAAAAFSRSGLVMVNMAKQGAPEIARLRAEAQRLGAVLSDENAAAAEQAQDSLTDLRASVRGLALQVGASLFPVLQKIIPPLTEWIVQNRELIRTSIAGVVDKVVRAGKGLFEWLRDVIPPTLEWVSSMGGLRTIAIVLGGILLATVVPAIVAIGAVIGPVGLAITGLVAGITAAAAAISASWETIRANIDREVGKIIALVNAVISKIPAPIRDALGLGSGGVDATIVANQTTNQAAPAAAAIAGASGQEIGGRIAIEVDDRGARVRGVEVSNPGLELSLEGGVLAPAL